MRILARSITSVISAKRSFLLGALLSSTVGGMLYFATVTTIEKDASERFVGLVHSVHFTLLERVKSYTDLLRGSASMLQTIPHLTREQFHRYVEGLDLNKEFPGVETINFAQSVSEAERPALEEKMRKDMANMTPPIPFTHINPPGRRDEYLVLTYIEPLDAWTARYGYDLRDRPMSRRILDESRDTGEISSSGLPIPMKTKITGLGMRAPIYRPGMPLRTVAERRAAYLGTVGIGFSIERLMEGVLSELPVPGMRLRLIGVGPQEIAGVAPKRLVLYDNFHPGTRPAPEKEEAVPDDTFRVALPIDYNKRNWVASFDIKKSAMITGIDVYLPWLAMLAGSVSTGLLYALFHTQNTSRRRAILLAGEMTEELRASEANLQRSNLKLRQLAAHADKIKEGERKRIAREIHDDLGQNLLALRIEADLLATRTGDRHPLLHRRAQRTLQQIDSTIKSVRQIINDLRPNVLDLGLNAAVDWQIADFRRRTGIVCELLENGNDIPMGDQCATALFRILQESLTNISRHSNATRVRVALRVLDGRITMTISDNGRGMNPGNRHKPGSFGLVGIEERVNILSGSFSITSAPTEGTTVSVSVPLHADQPVQVPAGTPPPPQYSSALV